MIITIRVCQEEIEDYILEDIKSKNPWMNGKEWRAKFVFNEPNRCSLEIEEVPPF